MRVGETETETETETQTETETETESESESESNSPNLKPKRIAAGELMVYVSQDCVPASQARHDPPSPNTSLKFRISLESRKGLWLGLLA